MVGRIADVSARLGRLEQSRLPTEAERSYFGREAALSASVFAVVPEPDFDRGMRC